MSISIKNKFCSIILPTLLASIALSLSTYAAFHCTFVQFVIPPATYSHEQAGLWGYLWWDRSVHKYTCHAYPSGAEEKEEFLVDGMWKAARLFSSLTLMFGGVALMHVLVTTTCIRCCCCCFCCCKSSSSFSANNNSSRLKQLQHYISKITKSIHKNEGNFYLLASLSSSLSLLFLQSNACQHNTIFNLYGDTVCRLSTGAKCTYAAMVFWFGAASLVWFRDEGESSAMMMMMVGGSGSSSSITSSREGGGTIDLEDGVESATVPLIQDVVFECEQQSVYSGRSGREG
mmetsp:Transcript_13476/g.20344  ORF Transcript_13476/g.20344 Transcript_13476/m.20344 type:complete len:288 (-) Transcript_13476:504-1367(-)